MNQVENLSVVSDSQSGIRLQKILSAAGIASRRAAEKLMEDGRVTVNGQVVKRLGTRADQSKDDIRVDGRRVGSITRRRYLLVNKPRGVVTTRHDPQRRKTVTDLVARIRDYVYPVGRLDYDSEGLLLLTNDGQLAQELTHPKHSVERVYQVTVEGVPSVTQLSRLRQGIGFIVRLRRFRPDSHDIPSCRASCGHVRFSAACAVRSLRLWRLPMPSGLAHPGH